MKKRIIFITLIIITLSCSFQVSFAQETKNSSKAKYVFLFIGDGMGLAHVSMAEAYLASQKGVIGNHPLSFTKFPTFGISTTYSANSYITCSSAAGTALSTGYKTNNGMLGVNPDTSKLTSITYKIHKVGIPIGIMSTVTIDHATPGAFYASSAKRSDYYDIAKQLPASGFEFFGGGGFVQPNGEKGDQKPMAELLEASGYKIAKGVKDIERIKDAKKIILFQEGDKNGDLPYALDRSSNDLTLKDIVKAGINHLNNNKGFFIMAEGGKIDWAAHGNDAKADILEVLDFADAIEVAYQFYLKHPNETLIIVTADHETGGFSLGREKGYTLSLKELDPQTKSISIDEANKANVKNLNNKANIGWTTTSHTGIAVPVFSIGKQSDLFSGRIDNTDIPKKICKAMGIAF